MSHLTPVPNDPEELRAWLTRLAEQDPTTSAGALLDQIDAPASDLAFEPFRNAEIAVPPPPAEPAELVAKVSLRGSKPPVWRRLAIPGDLTLDRLHDVLQVAMGWTDSHLHRFHPTADESGCYFVTDFDVEEGDEGTLEWQVRVDQLLREPGDRIVYAYDFGDGWLHDVRLEEVARPSEGPALRCLAGARACPPEDCGGLGGYEDLVAWHRAGRTAEALPPVFDDVAHAVDWLPPDWDPDAFDADGVTADLASLQLDFAMVAGLRPELGALLARLDPEGAALAKAALTRVDRGPLGDDLAAAVRHWRMLLDAVGEGLKLTAAGYLPPVVVERLSTDLGLDRSWIGRGNREDGLPPVRQLRDAAQRVGLLRKANGRLSPTARARGASDEALLSQVASRLPLGRSDAEQEAGLFALLLVAGGATDEPAIYEDVARLLRERGWQPAGPGTLDRWTAQRLAAQTVQAVVGPTLGLDRDPLPTWAPRAAAYVLRG